MGIDEGEEEEREEKREYWYICSSTDHPDGLARRRTASFNLLERGGSLCGAGAGAGKDEVEEERGSKGRQKRDMEMEERDV